MHTYQLHRPCLAAWLFPVDIAVRIILDRRMWIFVLPHISYVLAMPHALNELMLSTTSRFLTFASMRIYWTQTGPDQTKTNQNQNESAWNFKRRKKKTREWYWYPVKCMRTSTAHIHFGAFAFTVIAFKPKRNEQSNDTIDQKNHTLLPQFRMYVRTNDKSYQNTYHNSNFQRNAVLIDASFPFLFISFLF